MATSEERQVGTLTLISGPMIAASGMLGVSMGEILRVGKLGLAGEVIRVEGDTVYAQVFEDTQGMFLGEPVTATGTLLSVELGPGLLGSTYDGIQRPMEALRAVSGNFIGRGLVAPALDRTRKWTFSPRAASGQTVVGGDVLGVVQETAGLEHRVLVPPKVRGVIRQVVPQGEYTVTQTIAVLEDGTSLTLMHTWPVKNSRPVARRLPGDRPFLTGQRVLDCMFPIALGGSAIVPGGFGTGKTVVEQTLAKYCNAEVIVYVGCGERGNEMADVLDEFPRLKDPKTGQSLMNRTILVVNTSNMPVAAREASVYAGITIAEYYRDQGYDVALMADSTSRWAEALREISSRMEEMPGEEGYPTYLSARVSEFFERTGRVLCCGTTGPACEPRMGSLTLVGAVSPPGGDFSEPVVQTSLRVAGGFWGLDANLAYRRHYPAINWTISYSLYLESLAPWFEHHAPKGWIENRQKAMALLQRESEVQEVVQLVGPDALQDHERLILEMGHMVREVFLQQNAFSDNDAFSSLEKTGGVLELLLEYYELFKRALENGVSLNRLLSMPVREEVMRLRDTPNQGFREREQSVREALRASVESLLPQKG